MDIVEKLSTFLRQKISIPCGIFNTHNPRIHAECSDIWATETKHFPSHYNGTHFSNRKSKFALSTWDKPCRKDHHKFYPECCSLQQSSYKNNSFTLLWSSADLWWRHQMETFPRCWPFVRGIHRSPGEFPSQRPMTGSILWPAPNKRLSKHSRRRWFETRSLWRHCNVVRAVWRGWYWAGVTKPTFPVLLSSSFTKHGLPIEHHVHIWQASPQLSCIELKDTTPHYQPSVRCR